MNPSDPSCRPSFCSLHPSDPSCTNPSFCSLHPTDPTCNPTFCSLHPSDPSCNPSFCSLHPSNPTCTTPINPTNPTNPINPNNPTNPINPISPIIPYIKKIQTTLLSKIPQAVVTKINSVLKAVTTSFVSLSALLSLATLLFLNPLTLNEMFLIPFRLWSLFLTALGLKRRHPKWGTVYDSVTKQPLDPVYVSLVDLEGREVDSSITDIDGRYGFFVKPGVYKVIPKKTNYIFPSDKLSKRFYDEFYHDLYFGDYINISEDEVIVKNIPMDPVNFDWNEFTKNKKNLFKFYSRREIILTRISNWLFGIGFAVSLIALIFSFDTYNLIIFGLYIVMFILRQTSFKLKAKGRIFDKEGIPIAFSAIRAYSVSTNVEIAHKITDQMGRYYMLIPNGKYYVKIEKKNDDGSYSLIHTSEPFEVLHGNLNKVFNIN